MAQQQRRIGLKGVLLGDSSCGKTSFMLRWTRGSFSKAYKPTVGADFESKEVGVDGTLCLFQLWDTAGQERYHSLGSAFYRGADVAVCVFDVTSPASFAHLPRWLDDFFSSCKPAEVSGSQYPVVVVGTKCDLAAEQPRAVSDAEARAWCADRGYSYFEASAKTGAGVAPAMAEAARLAVLRHQAMGLLSPKQPETQPAPVYIGSEHSGSSKCPC